MEPTQRQSDLDVFQFMSTFTRCANATPLVQMSKVNETRICDLTSREEATPCVVSAEVAETLHSVATELLSVHLVEGMASVVRDGMKAMSGK